MNNEYTVKFKRIVGKTIYIIPIPEYTKRYDQKNYKLRLQYKVGITGWEELGALTTEYDYETAKRIYDKLDEGWVSRLKEHYQKFFHAEANFRSDFSILHIFDISPTKFKKYMRKRNGN